MKKALSILTLSVILAVQAFATCATVTVNGQCLLTDSVPTITLCGVGPTVATGGNSNAATITVGASTKNAYGQLLAVKSCVVTFATAFTNPPVVTLTTSTTGFSAAVISVSTTAMVVSFLGEPIQPSNTTTRFVPASFSYTAF